MKKRGRPRKKVETESRKPKPKIPPIVGAWLDIATGICMRCKVERRLYSPEMTAFVNLKVCAPCSQVCALSSLPAEDEEEEEDTDNIWLRTVLSEDLKKPE